MQEQDHLIRGTAFGGKVRAFAVNTTNTVQELNRRHGTCPTAGAALGRTLSAGAMIGAMLKGEEKLTIQVKGDGPIGQIVVDANAKGEIRGYVNNPQVNLPSNDKGKLDVAGAVGREGFIHITKDLGLKEPYRGSTPIVSGELAEDFTYYFAKSEQTPSVVALGVLYDRTDASVKASGGLIIQLMPGIKDEEIDIIERQISQLPPISALLDQGESLEEIIRWALPDAEIHSKMDINFVCSCSKSRVEQTLISLGQSELEQIIQDDGNAEVVCQFCNEAYQFNKDELSELLEQATKK
jgi:molecular chaperone Hsp33